MDPALLKRAPQYGMTNPHAAYYGRWINGRYVPYGNLGDQTHATFYSRLRGQNWTPYGTFGDQLHATFYARQRGEDWVPYGGYGDFVYKPVREGPEVLPGQALEAGGALSDYVQLPYSGLGQLEPLQPVGYTMSNVILSGVIGFLIGQFAGEHFERSFYA